ncbi:MAG: hypothetical protein ACXAES_09930 [Promethearchaeota archaeon]|jgi:hypothetical protein
MNELPDLEIIPFFEEISNDFKRKNQYFDILYDSFTGVNIEKSPSSENISLNLKKSGIVARTFNGSWNEIASDNFSDVKDLIKKLPQK